MNQLQQELNELKSKLTVLEAHINAQTQQEEYVFSEQRLIEFTREIQSRALQATKAAVKASDLDMEDYVDLDFDAFNRTIDIEVDEDRVYKDIISNLEDVFETDDDSIMDEITNVLRIMIK